MNIDRLVQRAESLTQEERDNFLLNALCFRIELAIEIAILLGANIRMYSNYPIKRAIEENSPDIVQLLIDEGLDVTENDNEALKLAKLHHREEIIKILEQAGAHL